ncbi:hypothetical protein V8F20_003933 [Naviculisporaceae sp. PSN 640]
MDTTTTPASRSSGATTISSDGLPSTSTRLVPRGTGKAQRLLSFFTPRRRGRKPANNNQGEEDDDDDAGQNGGGSGESPIPAHNNKKLSELLAERERRLGPVAFSGPLAYRQRQIRGGACGLDGIAEEEEEAEENGVCEKNDGGEEEEEKFEWAADGGKRASLAVTTGGGDVALREWYEEEKGEEVDAIQAGRGPLRALRTKLSQRFIKGAAK